MAQLGDVAGAVDAVRRAIALRPDYAAAHNNLGTLLQGRAGWTLRWPRFARPFACSPRSPRRIEMWAACCVS